jgi:hypothetical protein
VIDLVSDRLACLVINRLELYDVSLLIIPVVIPDLKSLPMSYDLIRKFLPDLDVMRFHESPPAVLVSKRACREVAVISSGSIFFACLRGYSTNNRAAICDKYLFPGRILMKLHRLRIDRHALSIYGSDPFDLCTA